MIVLGIDAAWTTTEPSGVALVVGGPDGWSCRGLAPSYRQFVELAAGEAIDWTQRPPPGAIDVENLLPAAEVLAGSKPDVVAVDMPLAFGPIIARRVSDTRISKLFGAAGAAVHSPSAVRPGLIAEQLRHGFEQRGYTLEVTIADPPGPFALIETYPHTVTMWLCNSCRRVPYKAAKSSKYWPGLPVEDRRRKLLAVWQDIVHALGQTVEGITLPLISPVSVGRAGALKALEDGIDALICAIAGISYLTGGAKPYGNRETAIENQPFGCLQTVRPTLGNRTAIWPSRLFPRRVPPSERAIDRYSLRAIYTCSGQSSFGDEFDDEYRSLDEDVQDALLAAVALLENAGPKTRQAIR